MFIYTSRDLGAAIRDRRKALGLDQLELATRVGVSRRWVIQVEAGKSGAAFGLLLRTMHALGLQMSLITEGSTETAVPHQPLATPDLDAVLARARRGALPK